MLKLPILISAILISGVVVYFTTRPAEPVAPVDLWAGYVSEVTPTLSEENKVIYEKELLTLSQQIADREAAGEYALDLYFLRGGYYQRLGFLKLGFEDYQKVVDGDPGNETAWNNMGDIRIAAGDILGAEVYYVSALEKDQSAVQYEKLYRYYTTYRASDRSAEVGALLLQAINDVTDNASFWVKLGYWYLAQGDKENAVNALRQASILNPDNQAIKEELEAAQAM